jgi:hypothetical protein
MTGNAADAVLTMTLRRPIYRWEYPAIFAAGSPCARPTDAEKSTYGV